MPININNKIPNRIYKDDILIKRIETSFDTIMSYKKSNEVFPLSTPISDYSIGYLESSSSIIYSNYLNILPYHTSNYLNPTRTIYLVSGCNYTLPRGGGAYMDFNGATAAIDFYDPSIVDESIQNNLISFNVKMLTTGYQLSITYHDITKLNDGKNYEIVFDELLTFESSDDMNAYYTFGFVLINSNIILFNISKHKADGTLIYAVATPSKTVNYFINELIMQYSYNSSNTGGASMITMDGYFLLNSDYPLIQYKDINISLANLSSADNLQYKIKESDNYINLTPNSAVSLTLTKLYIKNNNDKTLTIKGGLNSSQLSWSCTLVAGEEIDLSSRLWTNMMVGLI